MRFAIFAVPVGLLIVGVVTGFALSVHWSKATGDSPSPTANGDTLHTTTASGSSSTAVPTTAEHSTATVTSLSISTEVSQSTVTKTTTASASIPESIAAAASSFYGAWGTRIASEASKAAALATPSLTPSTTSSIQETSHAAQTSKTTTTPLPPTFTTSSKSQRDEFSCRGPLGCFGRMAVQTLTSVAAASTLVSTTERASGHGRMGVSRRPSKTSTGAGARANRVQFCGAPGTPCLGGRDGGEWDGENGY